MNNLRESDGEDELHRTAQYLARNVILYTHYVGEVSRIVDEHFSKALDQTTYNEQKGKRYFFKYFLSFHIDVKRIHLNIKKCIHA